MMSAAAPFLTYLPSPSRGVWYLGPVPIRAYALCIVAGILAALWIGDRRWVARGGDRGVIYDIALWAVPFGLVGGRLYHLMTDWPEYFKPGGPGLAGMWRIWDGGLGIWGAVALGGVGAWIACRRRGIPLPAFGDAIAPGIILAQAIGRLGNYFNQELFGRETTVPWGLEIFNRGPYGCTGPQPFDGVSTGELCAIVHPTFLYELLWNLAVFGLLLYTDRRFRMGHGRLFALYVAAYCVGRFWIELMRSDHASMPIENIRVNSLTSALVFVGAVVYMILAPKGREDPATLGSGEPVAVAAEAGESDEVVAAATIEDEAGEPEPAVSEADEAVAAEDEAEPEEPGEEAVEVEAESEDQSGDDTGEAEPAVSEADEAVAAEDEAEPVEPGEEAVEVEAESGDQSGDDTGEAEPAVSEADEAVAAEDEAEPVEPGEEAAEVEAESGDQSGDDTGEAEPAVSEADEAVAAGDEAEPVEPGEEAAEVEAESEDQPGDDTGEAEPAVSEPDEAVAAEDEAEHTEAAPDVADEDSDRGAADEGAESAEESATADDATGDEPDSEPGKSD